MIADFVERAAFQHYHAHDFNEVGYWIYFHKPLCPPGHAVGGGVESAQQNEQHHHKNDTSKNGHFKEVSELLYFFTSGIRILKVDPLPSSDSSLTVPLSLLTAS